MEPSTQQALYTMIMIMVVEIVSSPPPSIPSLQTKNGSRRNSHERTLPKASSLPFLQSTTEPAEDNSITTTSMTVVVPLHRHYQQVIISTVLLAPPLSPQSTITGAFKSIWLRRRSNNDEIEKTSLMMMTTSIQSTRTMISSSNAPRMMMNTIIALIIHPHWHKLPGTTRHRQQQQQGRITRKEVEGNHLSIYSLPPPLTPLLTTHQSSKGVLTTTTIIQHPLHRH